jgi:alpha-L-fucosidase 2
MAKLMRYTAQGSEWMDGLPIGNGRLAAMAWGGDGTDALSLNHERLWRGENRKRRPPRVADKLPEIRELLRRRDFFRASLLANIYMGGDGGLSPKKCRVDPYQPAGTLSFAFDGESVFLDRTLNITEGVAQVRRSVNGAPATSEFFASCENRLLYASWESGAPFSGKLALDRVPDAGAVYGYENCGARMVFTCAITGGMSHSVRADIRTDGALAVGAGGVAEVSGATRLEVVLDVLHDLGELAPEAHEPLESAADYGAERARHAARFSGLMDAVRLTLETDPALEALSIGERVSRMRGGQTDNGLAALYFDFGRYLLIASSVAGELPANLQGKWNDKIAPAWDCDYHFDINLQMNYWMAEPCAMDTCADALLKYAEQFYESGAEAAMAMYGCRGIWLPIQTDAWGIATPEAFGWAVWIGAAPWIAQHFWQRWLYSGDMDFLRDRCYKFLKKTAEFFEDYLVEDESGELQAMPSQSPENIFAEARGFAYFPVGLCVSSASDVQLIYAALSEAAEAARLLGVDAEKARRWEDMRDRLPPFKIGSDGRLLEWGEEFAEREDEKGHRHYMHLLGVHPLDLFTAQTRPAQFEAARKSFGFRVAHGSVHTGWTAAWSAAMSARFGDGAGFYEHYSGLICNFATGTLLNIVEENTVKIFTIEGNMGGVAAVLESLVSFTDGKAWLLRALPDAFANGSIAGVRIPGGHAIDLAWEGKKAVSLSATIGFGRTLTACLPDGRQFAVSGEPGEKVKIL